MVRAAVGVGAAVVGTSVEAVHGGTEDVVGGTAPFSLPPRTHPLRLQASTLAPLPLSHVLPNNLLLLTPLSLVDVLGVVGCRSCAASALRHSLVQKAPRPSLPLLVLGGGGT